MTEPHDSWHRPGGDQVPPQLDRPPMPDAVSKAVSLILLGMGLALVQMVVAIPFQAHKSNASGRAILGICSGVMSAGLWWWMARTCRQGHNWGRKTSTVFFGISSMGMLQIAVGQIHIQAVILVFDVLSWVVGLAAIVLLWNAESGPYFRAQPTAPINAATPEPPAAP